MKNLKTARPSPAIVIAVVALVAALAGTAVAGPTATTSISKKSVKKTAKKEAAKYFDANIGAASVANAATADSAASATSAANANQLGGQSPSAFRTGAAFVQSQVEEDLTTSPQTVLSTTITLPSTKTVTANASVGAVIDGAPAATDTLECNLRIAGVGGVQPEIDFEEPTQRHYVMPLTQSRTLGAGTHTVLVECSKQAPTPPDLFVNERSLSVVATG